MEQRQALWQLEFLRDLLKHHRKFTAFQKIAVLTVCLFVFICIFRNFWILALSCSYLASIYCTVLACQKVIRLHSHLPSETILILLESIEKLHENFLNYLSSKLEKNSVEEEKSETDSKENDDREKEEFFDASDELHPRSQSIFYVELDKTVCESNPNERIQLEEQEKKLNKLPTFDNCPTEVQKELHRLIVLIEKDFIQSWYNLFSNHFETLEDSGELLHDIVVKFLQRLVTVDIKQLASVLMVMFSNHVKSTKEARMTFKVQSKRRRKSSSTSENLSLSPKIQQTVIKSFEDCFGTKVQFHTALKSREMEYLYLNSLIELLILKLVPDNLNDSKALVCALREILSVNVLSLVMNLICDPTFLHERIIKITSDEELITVLDNTYAGSVEFDSSVGENMKSILKTSAELDQTMKDHQTTNVPQVDKSIMQEYVQEQRKPSFLDDTKLHYVSQGMCNECNRLCSKDRDKIEPHPHTCSLGDVQCFLNVKNHDQHRLSGSSGEGSPVFNFYISDMDIDRNSCTSGDDITNTHDIPSHMNSSPVEFHLHNVPLKSKHIGHNSDTKTLNKEREHETISKSLCEEQHKHDKQLGNINDNSVEHLSHDENGASSETESKFFLGGNIFNFQFPHFGKKTLSEKNRSSSNLENVSDTESEDFSNLRRCKSSTEFGSDLVVPGQEALIYPADAPLPFQDVHIKRTETAKEAGSLNPYTLYVIEYEAIHPTDEGIFVHRSGMVKRRFREFVNLQSRLEDNPHYKKSLKDIKGPRKWLTLPFGNLDKESVESRRKLLENFITSLIKKEDLCQGAELKEFLGYSGDGHIAFVRKVPENIGPRIDQRLVKTMSGMFDKIVEVLPSLPNELPRIIKQEKSRDDSETDKVVEDTDQIELVTEFDEEPPSSTSILCVCEKQRMLVRLDIRAGESEPSLLSDVISTEISYAGPDRQARCHRLHKALDDFVKFESLTLQHLHVDDDHNTTVGTSVLEWQEQYNGSNTAAKNQSIECGRTKSQSDAENPCLNDVPLCDGLLDILSELLHGCDSWMCRETVIKSIKTLLGWALERYLHSKIDFLVSDEMNTFYLRTLRETIWPDDVLSTESRPNYTDREKEHLKKQAARCLGNFLPGALNTLLGDEDFELTLEEIMEAIKSEKLNRHFWYTFLDILVEHIFPEIQTEEIQRKLSRS